ncbi:hypothetical protein IFM89_008094 [Coptis chinensis]|uniref:Uncharacterized protein n=1 Tax=Coptis chinensis TaxID=261450 RepID=A0A835IV51_9MAGN|nr:hypothetical protein IFM89_008094 [Coptis chinensis]
MELSHCLVKCDFQNTFVNTEFNHKRIAGALKKGDMESQIHMVSVQDGLSADKDRNDLGKINGGLMCVLPNEVRDVIKKINGSENEDKITCIISDMGWVLEVGERMGINKIALWTSGAGVLALTQKITFNGIVKSNEMVKAANWHVCNSTFELELAAFELLPDILPIDPLLAGSRFGQSLGHFWPEDSTCLNQQNSLPDQLFMLPLEA